MLVAPSPNIQMVTASLPRYLSANAMPAARGKWPPTMAWPPQKFRFASARCIEPPIPSEQPVFLPSNSAMTTLASIPQEMATPWSR